MEKLYCRCPFNDKCHSSRQWVTVKCDIQKEDCCFYKWILEQEKTP